MTKINVFIITALAFSFLCMPPAIFAEKDTRSPLDNTYNEGVKLFNRSEFAKAALKFESGLEDARKKCDSKAVSVFSSNLGLSYFNLGDYKKAVDCYNEALKIRKGSGDIRTEAFILTNLGSVYDQLGYYEKALMNYKQSLDILRNLKDQKGIRTNLGNLGILYDKHGDYSKAVAFYKEALEIAREIKDDNASGETLNNLGIAYAHLGDHRQALACYERSLKIARDKNDRNAVGNGLVNMGLAYSNLGDYKRSMSYFEEALEIKAQTGDKKGLSEALAGQGIIYNRLGYFEKALSNYERSLKIRKEIGVPSEQVEADIADIYLEIGRVKEAEKQYRLLGDPLRLGKLELIKKDYAGAIKYFDTLIDKNREQRNARVFFAAYCGKGMAYNGLKDYSRAKEDFEKAILFNEEDRESLSGTERERFFLDKVYGFCRYQAYEGMVSLLVNSGNLADAFYYSENLKARKFAEEVSKNLLSVKKNLPAEIAEEENVHQIAIRSIRKTMKDAYLNKEMDIYYSLEKQLKQEKDAMDKFIVKLRKGYPGYASINYPGPIKPKEVKLKEGEVLIEFEVTDDKTYLFILNDGKIDVREAGIGRTDLRKKVMEFTKYFEEIKNTKDLLCFKPEQSRELYSILFADALDKLKEGASIIIIPDEFLGMLPFEALVTEMPKKDQLGHGEYGPFPIGVKYLGDKFLISYGQSATALTLMRSSPVKLIGKDTVLLLCDPIFSKQDARIGMIPAGEENEENLQKLEAIQDWKAMGISGLIDKNKQKKRDISGVFPRLEKTKELASVSKDLFGAENLTVLSDEKSSEENIKELDFNAYKYVIFATHGILDETIPWVNEPALVLNLAGNSKDYDGLLTMSEIMGMKMSADTALLTACQTGVGENVNGEGVMGLGRAFQYAGAKNVIMSLWPIAEDATVFLSASFLKNVKSGKSPGEALKLAKGDIRNKGFEHPFFWSAFVLLND